MIETLTDNHAILLLYLAGELPEADRQEVAVRLASDSQLAQHLAALEALHQELGSGMAALDELATHRISTDRAIDIAVATIEAWQFGPRRIQQPVTPVKRRIWAWVAPASLAASILIAALIWIERHPAGGPTGPEVATTNPATTTTNVSDETPAANDSDINLALLQQSFTAGVDEAPRRIVRENRREVVAREDLSDFLLKTEVAQQ